MASHRSQRLKTYGGAEIEKLDNSRWRVIIRCEHANNTEGWFEKYRADTFPEFDTLASAPFGSDPASAYDDQYYADQRLISASLRYIPQKSSPVVEFVYETLTSTYTNEVEDVESSTENGLRTLERVQVARPGTAAPYNEDDVGVSTLTSGGKTLYLAGFEDASTERIGRIVTRWAEAGILRENERNLSPGILEVSKTFLAVESSFNGPIIRRSINNFKGLRTITVSRLQDKDGNSIVNGGTNLVNSFNRFQPFSYPGLATLSSEVEDVGTNIKYRLELEKAPANCKILCTNYVFFSTSPNIARADYTYDGSSGFWSPNSWASFSVEASGRASLATSFFTTQALRGYRTAATTISSFITSASFGNNAQFFWNGTERVNDVTAIDYVISVEKGPPDPIGSKWVLSVDVSDAFDDIDGNRYYKKVITVTETIPDQVGGEVPYD